MKRYTVTLLIVGMAVALQWHLWSVLHLGPFILLYPAVGLCALYGSAPVAVALSVAAAQILFFEPIGELASAWPQGALMQSIFAASGLTSWRLANQRRRATATVLAERQRYAELASELRTTLASIGDAVITTDAQSRVVFLNPQAELATGWRLQEAAGEPLDQVFPIIQEISRQKQKSPVEAVLKSGTIKGLANHTLLVRRDGSEISIEDSAAPIRNHRGEVSGVVLVFRDATASRTAQRQLQQSEQQFRAMFDMAGVGLFQANAVTGKFIRVNAKLCEMTGFSPQELLDRTVIDLTRNDCRTVCEERLLGLARGDVSAYEAETAYVTRAGSFIDVRVSAVRIGVSPVHCMSAVQNITDVKANEAQLVEAVHARDRFLSIASHELKTPLTSLKLQIQLRMRYLQRRGTSYFSTEKMTQIFYDDNRQVDRLASLVNDMLDISRIEAGKLLLTHETCDLGRLTQGIVDRCDLQLEAAGCPVNCYISSVWGSWDAFRVEQLILNLLTNAMRYGAHKPIDITVQQIAHEAVVTVRDRGIGIDVKDHRRIFECFERAIEAKEISGLGLGLYIAHKIVELHRGRIEVDSQPGHGATFAVYLPLQPAMATALAAPATAG